MEEIISLYISNITKSVNLVIKCKKLITILDLKELVAKELVAKQLDTYPCLFRLTNGTNLEEHLDALLTDLNINNEDGLYFMNKLNVDKAVLEEWFRLDAHNWDFHDNWCSELPLSEWEGVDVNDEGRVTGMSLHGYGICLIPDEICMLQKLKYLYLSNNNIIEIPKDFSKSFNLEQLDLGANHISDIPSGFSKLHKLEYIYLSHNNISLFPLELLELSNLGKIFLTFNDISAGKAQLKLWESTGKKIYINYHDDDDKS